jgi:hypothetical protein
MQFQTQSQFKAMTKSIGLTSTIGDSSKVAILTFGDTEKKATTMPDLRWFLHHM